MGEFFQHQRERIKTLLVRKPIQDGNNAKTTEAKARGRLHSSVLYLLLLLLAILTSMGESEMRAHRLSKTILSLLVVVVVRSLFFSRPDRFLVDFPVRTDTTGRDGSGGGALEEAAPDSTGPPR